MIDVAGVGYDVQIPLSTFYALSRQTGSQVSLHVHTHVREDALQLFGFASPDERAGFELLITISGVGPKLALAILSGIGVDDLRRTVRDEDRARLEKIPGVGRKTAERLLLELRDKIGRLTGDQNAAVAPGAETGGACGLRPDAISALVNLGYSQDAARRSVDRALGDGGEEPRTLEQLLRTALAALVR